MSANKTCFLVDDDEEDQEIFLIALKHVNESVRCFIAGNGVEAIKMLITTDQVIDIIFLDLNMPLMNGKQFLRERKKYSSLERIPVIIYSTSSELADKEETISLGAQDFITKPTYITDLVSVLSKYFSKN